MAQNDLFIHLVSNAWSVDIIMFHSQNITGAKSYITYKLLY